MLRFLADDLLLLILALGAGVGLYDLSRHRFNFSRYSPIVMSGLTSLLTGKLLSVAFQPSESRPFIEQGDVPGAAYIDNPGFPSDHALLATAVVGAVWYMTRNVKLVLACAVMAGVMMVARVLALVHTPLDIFGGICAGLVGMLWYLQARSHK